MLKDKERNGFSDSDLPGLLPKWPSMCKDNPSSHGGRLDTCQHTSTSPHAFSDLVFEVHWQVGQDTHRVHLEMQLSCLWKSILSKSAKRAPFCLLYSLTAPRHGSRASHLWFIMERSWTTWLQRESTGNHTTAQSHRGYDTKSVQDTFSLFKILHLPLSSFQVNVEATQVNVGRKTSSTDLFHLIDLIFR